MNTAGERPDEREPQVPSHIAAIVAVGVRIFNNLGAIRRHYL